MNFFGKFFIFSSCFWLVAVAFGGIDVNKQSARFSKQRLFGGKKSSTQRASTDSSTKLQKNKTPVSMAKINKFEYRSTHSKEEIKVQKLSGTEEE